MESGLFVSLVLLIFSVLLLVGVLIYLRRSASERQFRKVVKRIGHEHEQDIVIPDGMDGEIHIDHLLLTPMGILVLDAKRMEGAVFAGEKLNEWTAINGNQRIRVANPLADLRARVAAVRALVRDVPVHGRVVLIGETEFVRDRPDQAVTLDQLKQEFSDDGDRGREAVSAFHSSWQHVRLSASS